MYQVTALGELLIDFTPTHELGKPAFIQNPGGGPPNLLAAAARQGARTAFIGAVGEDFFGHYLKGVLEGESIYTGGLRFTTRGQTPLAFVHLSQGERSFTFFRSPGADTCLTKKDIDKQLLANSAIVHFSSLSFTNEPARTAVFWAVKEAKDKGAALSYDPNYRPLLWSSPEQALQYMRKGVHLANLLKVSEEEMSMLTNTLDVPAGARLLLEQGPALVAVTLGEKGCYFQTANCAGYVPPFRVTVVDTTGAGDAFWGTALAQLTPSRLSSLTEEDLYKLFLKANAAGAFCATRKGAIPAMPTAQELARFMLENQPV